MFKVISLLKLTSDQYCLYVINCLRGQTQTKFSTFTDKVAEKKKFGVYDIVKPGFVTSKQNVPNKIICPSYITNIKEYERGIPKEPEIKSVEQIRKIKKSCKLAKYILDSAAKSIKVGVTTDHLDKIVHNLCIQSNVYPSPLEYHGFPKSVCTSVNNVACHGIPDDRPLCDGDIINVDVTVYLNGYHGDCSATFAVGNVDRKGLHLIEATEQCLMDAISICCDGEYFCSIGQVISETARKFGYNVVPCFTGHGIGRYFHGPPDIYHCCNEYPGKMKSGMTFTIEPVLTQGEPEIIILEDGWTAVTADNARTAQFEHTVLIAGNRAEILTV
ncbi:hypothetical protein RUM44_006236 [Polyplax serrata]|uniref:Methionine aminopeptidase n=1 Tax=Polyplax serrata TaxID=468196 RepID=A0ABR1AHP9_POLSC